MPYILAIPENYLEIVVLACQNPQQPQDQYLLLTDAVQTTIYMSCYNLHNKFSKSHYPVNMKNYDVSKSSKIWVRYLVTMVAIIHM